MLLLQGGGYYGLFYKQHGLLLRVVNFPTHGAKKDGTMHCRLAFLLSSSLKISFKPFQQRDILTIITCVKSLHKVLSTPRTNLSHPYFPPSHFFYHPESEPSRPQTHGSHIPSHLNLLPMLSPFLHSNLIPPPSSILTITITISITPSHLPLLHSRLHFHFHFPFPSLSVLLITNPIIIPPRCLRLSLIQNYHPLRYSLFTQHSTRPSTTSHPIPSLNHNHQKKWTPKRRNPPPTQRHKSRNRLPLKPLAPRTRTRKGPKARSPRRLGSKARRKRPKRPPPSPPRKKTEKKKKRKKRAQPRRSKPTRTPNPTRAQRLPQRSVQRSPRNGSIRPMNRMQKYLSPSPFPMLKPARQLVN